MCLLRIPDDLEHAVLDDPLNNFIGGELVVAEGDVPHKLVQVFDTLDALLQELRLKALLDELELEDFHGLCRLGFRHKSSLDVLSGVYGLIAALDVQVA